MLERIKSLECGRNGSVVWKLSGVHHVFEAAKRAEVKSKNEKVPTDFCSPIILTDSSGYSFYVRLFPFWMRGGSWPECMMPFSNGHSSLQSESASLVNIILLIDGRGQYALVKKLGAASSVCLRVKETCRLVYCISYHTGETDLNKICFE